MPIWLQEVVQKKHGDQPELGLWVLLPRETPVNWGSLFFHFGLDSVSLIEIVGSPIHWINVLTGNISEGHIFVLSYDIPDQRNLSQLEIAGYLERKLWWSCFGRANNVSWRGNDQGTGIRQSLSNDLIARKAI